MRIVFFILPILYLLPAILSVSVYGLAPIWIVASLVVALLVAIVGSHPSKRRKLLAALLSWVIALGSVSLITSFDLQGEGFNDRFFFHYTLESLKIGLSAFPELVIGSTVYLTLAFLIPWFLPKEPVFQSLGAKSRAGLIAGLAAVSLFSFPPATSAVNYMHNQYQLEKSGDAVIKREVREVVVEPLTQTPKNLILIYAESLERLYFDGEMFPGLMETLGPLREEALDFTNVYQRPGTGWTIAGIVASQCGLPFNVKYFDGQEANIALASIDEPFKDEICLADILDAYGYHTAFFGGAKLSFAGKGKFLDANGYDETFGLDEMLTKVPDYRYTSKWGLYDDTLLDMAMQKIDALAAQDAPYMVTALTLDTHHPNGHISKDCAPYPGEDNPMLKAIYCNDRIVGEFISRLRAREDMDDTVIALVSDHLSMKNSVFDRLTDREDDRRLSWMVWDKDLPAGEIDAPATHFDIAPTLLEIMDIPNYHENNWGRSVLSGQPGFWHALNPEAQDAMKDVSYLDMDGNSALKSVRIDAEAKTIFIGDKPFLATRAGFKMGHSIFILTIDEKGEVSSILFADNMKDFNRIAAGKTFIAVSHNKLIAPDAVLVESIAQESTADNRSPSGKTSSAEPEPPVQPLYYYIGTPSSNRAQSGVTDSSAFITSRQMRRAIK